MTRRKPLTRVQRLIVKAPSSDLRHVTLAEKIAHPEKFSLKGEYLVPKAVKKITTKTAFVTRTRRTDFLTGVSQNVASAERKAGLRPYASAASEVQAAKTSVTRKFRKRFLRNPFYGSDETAEHTFRAKGDRDKKWSSAEFGGDHLVVMQNYRTDWHHAVETGYDNFLLRYDDLEILDVNGTRVFPETDLEKLKEFLESLSERQRKRFDEEVFYAKERI